MSELRDQGLAALLADTLAADRADPELLARYAKDPGALSSEERDEIEFHLGHTPGCRAQLAILRRMLASSERQAAPTAAAGAPSRARVPAARGAARRAGSRALWAPAVVLLSAAAAVVVAVRTGVLDQVAPLGSEVTRKPGESPSGSVGLPPGEQAEASRQGSPGETAGAGAPVAPQTAPGEAPRPAQTQVASLILPEYRRPAGVGDRPRLGSQTRSTSPGAGLTMEALAPAHVGRTLSDTPELAWFLSKVPERGAVLQFSLSREQSNSVVASKELPLPSKAGIQRVSLAELGASLTPGTRYRWAIVLRQSSRDAGFGLAQGFIERIEPDSELQQKLSGAAPEALASIYAASGLWYDSLGAVLGRLREAPDDASAQQALVALLKGIGLADLAKQGI